MVRTTNASALILPLLCLPTLVLPAGAPGGGERPAFGVAEGTKLRRTFEQRDELELRGGRIELDGETIAEFGDEAAVRIVSTETIVFVDAFVAVDDERPLELVREFETLEGLRVDSGESDDGSYSEETARASDLQGTRVRFKWGDGEYALDFDESEASEDLLEELQVDADFWRYLPAGEVEEGDRWEIDAVAFDAGLSPGGDLHFLDEDEDEEDDEVSDQLSENMAGEAWGTFAGVREEDGVRVAVIELEANLSSSSETEEENEDGEDVAVELTLKFVCEGELLWDLEGGHMHALRLDGEVAFTRSATSETEGFGNGTVEICQVLEFGGTYSYTGEIERVD